MYYLHYFTISLLNSPIINCTFGFNNNIEPQKRNTVLKLLVSTVLILLISNCDYSSTKTITSTYPNGTLKSKAESKLIHDSWQRHGTFQKFDPSGVPVLETHYFEGKERGVRIEYYPSGTLKSKGTWDVSGYIDTLKVYYEDGTIESVIPYNTRLKNGTAKYYHPNATMKSTIVFEQNTIHGEMIRWYSNGIKKSIHTYRKGLLHGAVKAWLEDGQLQLSTLYSNDTLIQNATEPQKPNGHHTHAHTVDGVI